MAARPNYVILGGGLAGHRAAETLREAGFDGQVTLVSAEPVPPYDRPPLSKAFLQAKKEAADLPFATPEHYAQLEIDLLLGTEATAVDFDARRLTLATGDALTFDGLLIATGASLIRLRQPGFNLPGVRYLRTLADAEALRSDLAQAERVLVVGASFIGSEVAASARTLGREVILVDLLSAPMVTALGERIGQLYTEIHRSHGVDLRMGHKVVELRGSERVEEAVLASGERIPCDLVVVGVGVRPAVDLFEGTSLACDNGVVVDEHCAASIDGVYAAGDVANWWHPVLERHIRVEHFDNAGFQGAAAARAMVGQPEPYAPVPYFWSDQYDVNLQYAGYPVPWDDLVLRGEPENFSVTAFYLADGRVRAAATINRPRDLRASRRIIEAGGAVDPAQLADPATDLRALAKELRQAARQ